MAIKKLQNNFTTPEQSKRLLELGVPEDSADCYYHHYFTNDPTPLLRVLQLQWGETIGAIRGKSGQEIVPCWSAGQLIEIIELCYGGYFNSRYFGHTLMEDVLLKIEEQIDSMDFSKLED